MIEGMASQYGNLGIVFQARGDLDSAREKWSEARDLYDKLGARHKSAQMQNWIDGLSK
jgi:hypothetical protein